MIKVIHSTGKPLVQYVINIFSIKKLSLLSLHPLEVLQTFANRFLVLRLKTTITPDFNSYNELHTESKLTKNGSFGVSL